MCASSSTVAVAATAVVASKSRSSINNRSSGTPSQATDNPPLFGSVIEPGLQRLILLSVKQMVELILMCVSIHVAREIRGRLHGGFVAARVLGGVINPPGKQGHSRTARDLLVILFIACSELGLPVCSLKIAPCFTPRLHSQAAVAVALV